MESKQPFARAEAEGGIPSTTDLWDDDHPIGPYIVNALRARELYKRDVNYIVRDGEIKIVNCSTGRVMPISRWTDDLHQVRCVPSPGCSSKCNATKCVRWRCGSEALLKAFDCTYSALYARSPLYRLMDRLGCLCQA